MEVSVLVLWMVRLELALEVNDLAFYLINLIKFLCLLKDSGSPLVQRDGSGNLELVGINSWRTADICGGVNTPDVFIHISAFSNWINGHTAF